MIGPFFLAATATATLIPRCNATGKRSNNNNNNADLHASRDAGSCGGGLLRGPGFSACSSSSSCSSSFSSSLSSSSSSSTTRSLRITSLFSRAFPLFGAQRGVVACEEHQPTRSGSWRRIWGGASPPPSTLSSSTNPLENVVGTSIFSVGSRELPNFFRVVGSSCAIVYALDGKAAQALVNDDKAIEHDPKAARKVFEQLQPDELKFLGSGFIYGQNGRFVTCAHLFDGRYSEAYYVLRFGNEDWRLAKLIGISTGTDVAVLQLLGALKDQPGLTAYPSALVLRSNQELPKQGESVAVCGCTQFGTETVGLVGVVSQPHQVLRGLTEDIPIRFIQVAVPTLPGMSGSPVLDERGNVVGMLAKKFEEHGLALPATRVATVAAHIEKGLFWRTPVLGLVLGNGGSLASRCVVVKGVQKNSSAGLAGLQVQDEVLEIEGTPVYSVIDIQEVLSLLGDKWAQAPSSPDPETVPIEITVRRDGKIFKLRISASLSPAGPRIGL